MKEVIEMLTVPGFGNLATVNGGKPGEFTMAARHLIKL